MTKRSFFERLELFDLTGTQQIIFIFALPIATFLLGFELDRAYVEHIRIQNYFANQSQVEKEANTIAELNKIRCSEFSVNNVYANPPANFVGFDKSYLTDFRGVIMKISGDQVQLRSGVTTTTSYTYKDTIYQGTIKRGDCVKALYGVLKSGGINGHSSIIYQITPQ